MYSSNTIRNTLLRRGSIQGIRPPPPVRRTPSITSTNQSIIGSLENLPPPPAFLLENSAAGLPSSIESPNSSLRAGVNVAETIKALTELKHTPASPSATRRNQQVINSVQNTVPQLSSFQSPQQPQKIHQNSIYANPNQVRYCFRRV